MTRIEDWETRRRAANWAPLVRVGAGAAAGVIVSGALVTDGPLWRVPAAAAVLAIAFLVAPGVDRWAGRGITSGWALATSIGIYLGVPETDHVVGVVAVLIVVTLAELTGRARVDGFVVAALDVVLVWSVLRGAAGRPGALVAGMALLGLLVVAVPASLPHRPGLEPLPSRWRGPALVALQLVFCVIVARFGAVRTTGTEAVIVSVTGLTVLFVTAWYVMGRPDVGVPTASDATW